MCYYWTDAKCETIYQNKTSLSFSDRSIHYLMVEKGSYGSIPKREGSILIMDNCQQTPRNRGEGGGAGVCILPDFCQIFAKFLFPIFSFDFQHIFFQKHLPSCWLLLQNVCQKHLLPPIKAAEIVECVDKYMDGISQNLQSLNSY